MTISKLPFPGTKERARNLYCNATTHRQEQCKRLAEYQIDETYLCTQHAMKKLAEKGREQ